MSIRFPATGRAAAALAAAFVLGLMFLAGTALADGKRVVHDAKFESVALSRNGRIDIVEATASRRGTAIEHTIKMRAKLKPGRSEERPGVLINTRGGRRSSPEFLVFGSTIFKVRKQGDPKPIGSATLTSSKRTWRFSFQSTEIPGLGGSYGWAAITQKGSKIADIAPDKGYVNSP